MERRAAIPWRTFDSDGNLVGLVFAPTALDATSDLPPGHSVYVGGPSPDEPERPWWIEAWNADAINPDDLIANDPRLGRG